MPIKYLEDLTDQERELFNRAVRLSNTFTQAIPDETTVAVMLAALSIMLATQAVMNNEKRETLIEWADDIKTGALLTYDQSTIPHKSKAN